MPTITVVTAVLPGRHEHLPATHQSLTEQQLPSGWDWQWIVQEDGDTGIPAESLPSDDRIEYSTGRWSRAATARTLGLGRASGELIRALDADDLLPHGALARDIDALLTHPIAWCVSPTLDLNGDGSMSPGPRDPLPGPLPSGVLADGERDDLLQVVGTTMCAYTDLVRALGGWQALPGIEDVALLLAAEAVSDGWMLAQPGLLYRKWPRSSTQEVGHTDGDEQTARRKVVLDRVSALRASGWRWDLARQAGKLVDRRSAGQT